VVTLVDNITGARLIADKNIFPGIDDCIKDINWTNYRGKVYSGIKYFPLRKEFVKSNRLRKKRNAILVSMGGADVNNLTPVVMKALVNIGKKVNVVVGPAFKNKKDIENIAVKYREIFQLYYSPDKYTDIADSSLFAITALGISIYEFSYMGIPTVIIGNYKSDAAIGKALEKKIQCKYMGYYKNVQTSDIYNISMKLTGQKKTISGRDPYEGVRNISNVVCLKKEDVVINIAAGKEQIPLLKKLSEMEYKVISVDKNSNAPGFRYSHRKLIMSTYDYKNIIKKLKVMEKFYNYKGVVCKSSGIPSLTAARIANYYKLPGIKYDSCLKLIFKDKMANVSKKTGIPTPAYINLKNYEKQAIVKLFNKSGRMIIKPSLALVGKKDVKVVNDLGGIRDKFKLCKKNSLNGIVQMQEYIEGSGVTAMTIIYKNKIHFCVLVDESVKQLKNNFVGVGLIAPSKYVKSGVENSILKYMSKLITALKIKEGFIAASFRVSAECSPLLTEINVDLLGDPIMDELFHCLLPDIDVMAIIIKILTKNKIDALKKFRMIPSAIVNIKNTRLIRRKSKYLITAKNISASRSKNMDRKGFVILSDKSFKKVKKDFKLLQNLRWRQI